MINILFWNINKKSGFEQTLADIVKSESIDILILAEAMNVDIQKMEALSGLTHSDVVMSQDSIALTPKLFSNNNGFKVEHYNTYPNTKRMIFYFLEISGRKPILLTALHMRSKLMRDKETQIGEASKHGSYISQVEDNLRRTIVVGDFNVNPYELGMISPMGFNATSSKMVAKQVKRKFMKDNYPFFYSPLWSSLGDIEYSSGINKLPGNYFFDNSDSVLLTYWNVIDNVLVRPELFSEFDFTSVRFIESSGQHTLVQKSGDSYHIDKVNYSDHLPLKFKII